MTTKPLAETIAGLEALLADTKAILSNSKLVAFSQYLERYVATLESALTHLRSQEDTQKSATYWMLERNSKHPYMPPNEPVLWFKERGCFAQGDVDRWTPHSDQARHFQSKAEAEEYLKNFSGEEYEPLPDVTEHMDMHNPDT